MDNNEQKNQLDTKIWQTKGSRFNAYRRLAKRNSILTFVTSLSSIHLLSIGIIQLSSLIKITSNQSQWLSFTSIILSIIILAYSLFESGKEHGLKSEKHHLCALELDTCYSKLAFIKPDNSIELSKLAEDYNEIKQKHSLNHEPIDNNYFKLEHLNSFDEMKSKNILKRLMISFSYKYYDILVAGIFICAPLSISVFILSK